MHVLGRVIFTNNCVTIFLQLQWHKMSIAKECKSLIKLVFEDTMASNWMTLSTKNVTTLNSLLESPSTGENKFDFVKGVNLDILSHFRRSLEACFDEHSHGNSFWDNILLQVNCSFAGSLVSYRLGPKEADVVNGLLLPML